MASSPKQSAVEKGNGKGLESDQQLPIALKPTGAIAGERGSSSGASDSTYCIFKIPESLNHNKDNSYGYQPTIVSIGPYHQDKPQLKLLEIKKEFKELFIRKARDDVNEDKLLGAVGEMKGDIERSYSNPFGVVDYTNLIPTMVLDGCFILTLFLATKGEFPKENAIFRMPWAMPSIRRDLLLLENQIPLFVLQILLNTVSNLDLNQLAFDFFKDSFENRKQITLEEILRNQLGAPFKPKHLLDLVRQTLILIPQTTVTIQPPPQTTVTIQPPPPPQIPSSQTTVTIQPPPPTNFVRLTLPANKLLSRGIKFKVKKNVDSFLDISFKNGVLKIPEIILDDFLSVVLLNCIAFEQFYENASTDVTSYTMFMGCLVNSKRDVAYFVEKGIIQNYLGTEDELSLFFKRVLNDYVFDKKRSYLAVAIKDVDTYSSNPWNVGWATFRQDFLGSPWIFASKVAALAILLLTIAQVVLAAIALKSTSKTQII